MKVIIDIPKEVYKNIQRRSTAIQIDGDILENAVLNGEPLPEGHGDLIDAGQSADVIPIPKGATNGDMIKAILKPRADQIKIYGDWVEIEIQSLGINFSCELNWWNAPYKGVKE